MAKLVQRLLDSGMQDEPAELELCSALEWSIPGLLKQKHDYWKHESLDGVLAIRLTAIGNVGLELFGRCILLSDQTLVPLLVYVNVAAGEVVNVTGFLGEPGDGAGGMQRVEYGSQDADRQYLELLRNRPTRWAYQF